MNWIQVIAVSMLLAACTAKPPEPPKAPDDRAVYTVPTGEDRFRDQTHGQETWFAVGAMSGAEGMNANGVVQAHRFEDGTYRLELQLNIERAPDGHFYEAWLVGEGSEPRSLGHLRSSFGDVRHALQFDADEDLQGLMQVQLTLEADDGDPQPTTGIVATGTLRVTQR